MTPRQDLYWRWADATGYQNFEHSGMDGYAQLLVECVSGKSPVDLDAWLVNQHGGPWGFVPRIYQVGKSRQFCSLWIHRDKIALLPGRIVNRFQLALARTGGDAGGVRQLENGRFPPKGTTATEPLNGKVVLAIIEDAINFDHSTFKNNAGNTRFKIEWDQNTNRARAGLAPRFGYKTFGVVPIDRPELRRASHGTHIASLAGGTPTPQSRLRHSHSTIVNKAVTDGASTADLAGVVLPARTVQDTSGGALAVNVFDAINFLIEPANVAPDTPVVVNLSFGTMAGAHDGTSMLDAALDELRARKPGKLWVVVAAGNSFESQCHAQYKIGAGESQTVTWRVLPDDRTPNFLEIWLKKGSTAKITLRSPDGSVKLVSTNANSAKFAINPLGQKTTAILRSNNPSSSNISQLVLLAVSPTRAAPAAPTVAHGDWTVEIANTDATAIDANLWIERDNSSFGRKALGRQSYLVDPALIRRPTRAQLCARTMGVSGFGSLNALGTQTKQITVGAYDLRTGKPCNLSAAGSNMVRCPDGSAPSDESPMLQGLPGAAHCGGGTVRIGGTSVATPLVSRFFANLLQHSGTVVSPAHPLQSPVHGYDEIEGLGKLVF